MFITLIVSACVAALVAGVILLGFKLVGRKAPKGLLPLAMGVAVIAYVTYARYTWHETMIARLPETLVVIETGRGGTPFEPWTYIWPRVTHFAAVDRATARHHPQVTGMVLVTVMLVAEDEPSRAVPQVVDCRRGRRAPVGGLTLTPETLAADTLPWQSGRSPAALFDAVCEG
ncbi:hypothetical protein [Roseospira visakhapatnamensis]|uniref:Uncharacterized protein n=1 Tax=Roseospira visakhapatnamensis TaxID=390880 RepID=A0A7W6RCK9_9PROT|nr:hypothetical protein [Roseospira visakhapatnamensis]MBB4265514.1 hypothetical protein [Roseospira visakhapatnamensis]